MPYSVIIPTMGRDTLDSAINSVLAQKLPAQEIIVVAGRSPVISERNRSRVRLIESFKQSPSVWTAAHNRNIGIQAVGSKVKYVAFLDDDDLWIPDKMSVQINFLERNENHVSISSAIYKLRKYFYYRRPLKILTDNQDILYAHYGKRRIFPTPFYTPTPGIVVEAEIARELPFDETLPGFEDTWWLHQLQKNGSRIHQHREALVVVNANPIRSISRDTLNKNISWAKKLSEVDLALAENYLSGICLRNAILGRRWNEVRTYFDAQKLMRSYL
jgi:glycosyltransferase involved in cell wall biosynthesis